MTQIEDPRLLYGDRIPECFVPALHQWFLSQCKRHFRRAETEIHCLSALAWADSSRPSIVQAYRLLCTMIDEDAARGGEGIRKPSMSTFRTRVRSLPPDFVAEMRFGRLRRLGNYELVTSTAAVFETAAARY